VVFYKNLIFDFGPVTNLRHVHSRPFSFPFQKAPITIINQIIASFLYIPNISSNFSQSLWISLYRGIWGELPRQASKRVGGAFREARSSWVLQTWTQGLTLTNLRTQWRPYIQIDSHITALFSYGGRWPSGQSQWRSGGSWRKRLFEPIIILETSPLSCFRLKNTSFQRVILVLFSGKVMEHILHLMHLISLSEDRLKST
jgi:hypothetical protein